MPRTLKPVPAGAAAAARYDDVRNGLAEIPRAFEAAHLEVFARYGDDGDGHLLKILLTASRRDDDLLETFLSESGLIRQTAGARQCCHDSGVDLVDFHEYPQLDS